jgi:hypothetical protein
MQKIWKIKKILSNGGESFLEMCVSCVLYYAICFCTSYHNDEVGGYDAYLVVQSLQSTKNFVASLKTEENCSQVLQQA